MADASYYRAGRQILKTLAAAVAVGEIHQLADGRGAVFSSTSAGATGQSRNFAATGQWAVAKQTGIALLDGGRAYWDYSANRATFRKVGDRDFYLGRVVGDAASAAETVIIDFDATEFGDDHDLARDAFETAIVGTQALGGLGLYRRGGAHLFVLDTTNEAQKLDALGDGSFANAANAIVEFCFTVLNDGAGGAPDVSIGIASGTHASDADSIAQHLLMHLDGNATAIKFQSKDGTTTVAATDSLTTYTEGSALANRKEVWFDMRDPSSVKLYVDGVRVLDGTVFNVAAAASEWKLLAHVEKTAAADVYQFKLNWLRARTAEQ